MATLNRRSPKRSGAARSAAIARWARKPSLAKLLEARTDRSGGPDACWPWMGDKNPDGYGKLWHDYHSLQAHKVALELKLARPLADGEVTRHTCIARPECCNPEHLIPGSPGQNNQDAIDQGRARLFRPGEENGGARLTEEQVAEILRVLPTMDYGRFELLGRRYGVTGKAISNIYHRKKWRHVAPGRVAKEAA